MSCCRDISCDLQTKQTRWVSINCCVESNKSRRHIPQAPTITQSDHLHGLYEKMRGDIQIWREKTFAIVADNMMNTANQNPGYEQRKYAKKNVRDYGSSASWSRKSTFSVTRIFRERNTTTKARQAFTPGASFLVHLFEARLLRVASRVRFLLSS